MNPFDRPLRGLSVNISISESDESESEGFPTWQVNRATLQITSALCGQGATVVFGHDWREDGVMEAVYGFARQMQPPFLPASDQNQPLLYNLLPWPDRSYLNESDLERLGSTLRVEKAGLPEELRQFGDPLHIDPDSGPFRYLRARGLTLLRRRLTDVSHARLCVGGRLSAFTGRYPGIIEEALMSVQNDKPLYIAGFLGGAAIQIIDAFERRRMPEDFWSTPLRDVYSNPPLPERLTRSSDTVIDPPAVWNQFAEIGVENLGKTNGLTIDENAEIFHTAVIDRVIELLLTGLSRLRKV